MAQIKANDIWLEYETHGDGQEGTILMIMALGAQLTHWPKAVIDKLVSAGFKVITYDARDIGLSQKFDAAAVPDRNSVWQALFAGETPDLPYTLCDLERDAVGLLDALDIESAHIVGLSLGSWIAQMVAANHPERVLSLTLLASNSGNPDLPKPDAKAMAVLGTRPPDANVDYEAYVQHWINGSKLLGSKTAPKTEAEVRAQADRDFKRCYSRDGAERQLLASFTATDRRPLLKRIKAPAVVVHGAQDTLVPPAAGEDVANHIPNSKLVVLEDMGHDLPALLYDQFVASILESAAWGMSMRQAETSTEDGPV